MQAENILLQDWQTPFNLPPFEAIRDEDFMPAFAEAMRLHLAQVEEIANDPAVPSFTNTIEALERAGRALENASSVFFNLVGRRYERRAAEHRAGPLAHARQSQHGHSHECETVRKDR